jgi:hypothetical protein
MKPTTTTTTAPVTVNPFDNAKRLLDGIKRHTAFALAGQIALGIELIRIKNALGFVQGGTRQKPHDAVIAPNAPTTWTGWLKQELAISDDTARRFMHMAEHIRPKLKKLGGTPMLAILDKPVADVTESDRDTIMSLVAKCTDCQTQAEFLQEIGFAKIHVPLQGGDSGVRPDPALKMQQEEFAFFFKPLSDFVTNLSRKTADEVLWKMPLREAEGDVPSLTQVESTLKLEFERVREIRRRRERGDSIDIDV